MRYIVLAGVFAGAIAPAAAADESGRLLFTKGTTPACAVCHTLKDAGAVGAVGPVLDEIQPTVERVTNALRNGIGQMPSYKATLSDAQIEALAKYVAGASRAASAGR